MKSTVYRTQVDLASQTKRTRLLRVLAAHVLLWLAVLTWACALRSDLPSMDSSLSGFGLHSNYNNPFKVADKTKKDVP